MYNGVMKWSSTVTLSQGYELSACEVKYLWTKNVKKINWLKKYIKNIWNCKIKMNDMIILKICLISKAYEIILYYNNYIN